MVGGCLNFHLIKFDASMFDPELYKYSIYSNVFVDLNEHMIQKHNRGKCLGACGMGVVCKMSWFVFND
jgi:hypothetical protein